MDNTNGNRVGPSFSVRMKGPFDRSVHIDKTLSLAGSAADAKTVGEAIALERARINNLTTLKEGSTTGDAELQDIRVDANGNVYATAGQSLRTQFANVHESISNATDALYELTPLSLPSAYSGTIKATLYGGSKLFSGTHNVIALLGMKQGTTTANGLTITVADNTVSITGTATAETHFSLYSWQTRVPEYTGELPTIPERLYTLSQRVISGTEFPVVAIRSKISGNVVIVQNNTQQYNHSAETCGHLYVYIPSGATYNCSFVLALFPYATNNAETRRTETSSVREITTSGLYDAGNYLWATGNVSVSRAAIKVPRECLCRYEERTIAYTGAVEVIDVYIPAKVGYVHAIVGHCVGNNCDVWKIVQFASVTDSLVKRFNITQYGETEMAIKIQGRDDFIGGFTHADEITNAGSVVVLVDGLKINPASMTELTEFKELRISEVSTMYDPADHVTAVATHAKEYVITEGGIALNQVVTWHGAYTLDASYMPMLCAIRGNDTVSTLQITDTYIDNGDYMPYDVGTGGFTSYPFTKKTGVDRITLFSDKSGLCATVNVLESPDLPGAISFLYNGENTYNKIYCAVCGFNKPHITANGEKWRVRAQFQFAIGPGTDIE